MPITISITPVSDTMSQGEREALSNANIVAAEICDDFNVIMSALEGWVRCREGKNYQDLEKYLRANKRKSYVFAAPNPVITYPLSDPVVMYCTYPTRERNLEEIMKYNIDYNDNFEKLSFIKIIRTHNLKGWANDAAGDTEIFDAKQQFIFNHIRNVTARIKIVSQ